MSGKYRFRKMFFICYDNRVIADEYEFTNAYKRKEYVDKIAHVKQEDIKYPKLWEKDKHKPKVSVEGFYLVHESLFDELLSKHSKD